MATTKRAPTKATGRPSRNGAARTPAPAVLVVAHEVEVLGEHLSAVADSKEFSSDVRAMLFALGHEFQRLADRLREHQPALGQWR